MSDLEVFGFNASSAAKFNKDAFRKLAWVFPQAALGQEPLLKKDPGSEEFAIGVYHLQQIFWPTQSENQDGKLGSGTWAKILKTFDKVEDSQNYVVQLKRRVLLPEQSKDFYQMVNFDQKEGIDLHQNGDFTKGRGGHPFNYVVLHWGSTSADRLSKTLTNRSLSSHFGIDQDKIYQYLDMDHRAWHGGKTVNNWSVGIDFCQQPTEGWAKILQKQGLEVKLIDNPTDRGEKKITTLNPQAVKAGRQFIEDLCKVLKIPFQIPRGKKGLEKTGPVYNGVIPESSLLTGEFKGVIGHHHVRETKWDIAPWWVQLFGDLY